jgi:protoheme IX farnesyltransferase
MGGILAAWMFYMGWREQRYRPRTLVLITCVTVLFAAQGVIGPMIATGRVGQALAGLHAVSGAAVWALMVMLSLDVGLATNSLEAAQADGFVSSGWRQRISDFVMLTKPVIVLLLLATTLGGMVVGAGAWPDLPIVFWTLLGGTLAAGGSGAINQFIDRDVDARMKRTARRPLAAGRLRPAEALAFGVGLCLLAFFALALYVNLLAALLSVAGMVYYVWLYSLVLKKTTVQNIVIGGGAGAIPPLVGWAAATGGLTWPAALLFAIIFLWTPPHFWALALIRAKDYARGGIPMLPVVRGERETRRQILIYTLVLVAITLMAWPVGLAGWIYTLGAVALGLWLVGIAYRLWREYTPKLAWKMYRQSSMYLLYLFVLLAVDALAG